MSQLTVEEWINSVLKKYSDKYNAPKSEVDHVIDFLRQNSNFKLTTRTSYESVKLKADKWLIDLNNKIKNINSSGQVAFIKSFPNGFNLVRLVDQVSKVWEGKQMGHCVAAYRDHDGIYSLRDNEQMPHCTIELLTNRVVQIKGKANGAVSPKYIDLVFDILKHFDCEVEENQLLQLGYAWISLESKELLNKYFSNAKVLNYNSQAFLYIGNKITLEKPFTEVNNQLMRILFLYDLCDEGVKTLFFNDDGFENLKACAAMLETALKYKKNYFINFIIDGCPRLIALHTRPLLIPILAQNDLSLIKKIATIDPSINEQLVYAAPKLNSGYKSLDLEIIQYLEAQGLNLKKYADNFFNTACAQNNAPVVGYLMPFIKDLHFGIFEAVSNGNINILKFLLDQPNFELDDDLWRLSRSEQCSLYLLERKILPKDQNELKFHIVNSVQKGYVTLFEELLIHLNEPFYGDEFIDVVINEIIRLKKIPLLAKFLNLSKDKTTIDFTFIFEKWYQKSIAADWKEGGKYLRKNSITLNLILTYHKIKKWFFV